METETLTVWYIGSDVKPFKSVMFATEEDALKCLEADENSLEGGFVYGYIETVTFDPKVMDYRARAWVADSYENVSLSHWSREDYWSFIEEYCFAGRSGFILNTVHGEKF